MPIELPHGPRKGETFELEIERLGPKGVGVAHLDALVGLAKQYSVVVWGALGVVALVWAVRWWRG